MSSKPDMLQQIQADMDRAIYEMNRQLAIEWFKPNPFLEEWNRKHPIIPPTRWQRLRRRYGWPIQGYVSTLWCALRGDVLVPPPDPDEY